MFILHLALGGCLKAPPVAFGITADTGGHIAYVLDAAQAQALHPRVDAVSIVTRLFDDPALSSAHARPQERLGATLTIDRIATADRRYLEKEALAADLDAFADAFCTHLAGLARRPDVIHAHFADAAAVAIVARRRFGIPFVYTPHALGIDKLAQRIAGEGLAERIDAERRAIANADAILVSSHDEAERQVSAYGVAVDARIHRIPPGVPHRAAPPAATLVDRLAFADPTLPIILAIARPVAKKNLAALVRAYAVSPALQARANLVVLAGQHDRPCSPEEAGVLAELAALAAPLGDRIALPAAHDGDDVAGLYAKAARGGVFVNPALHEPFGLTLIEAAAAGVPVVATRNGGPAEIVAGLGHGLLVDPRDDAAITAACLAIVADPDRHARFARAAIANVARYDWDRYAAASVSLYATLRVTPALLACDIDGTLTGDAGAARAFAEWRRASALPFVVATGRSFDAARAVLRRWRLPEPDGYIVDVGTRIMRMTDGAWRECPAYAAALDRDWDRAAVVRVLATLAVTPQPAETAGPHKLSFFGTARDAAAIRAALSDAGLAARVIFSHGELIDVLAPHGGKAAAVAAYAAGLGLTLTDCIAAGDSGNDADMLGACGHAIVVGNADGDLAVLVPRPGLYRAAAHHAAGVIEGLERLGLASSVAVAVAA